MKNSVSTLLISFLSGNQRYFMDAQYVRMVLRKNQLGSISGKNREAGAWVEHQAEKIPLCQISAAGTSNPEPSTGNHEVLVLGFDGKRVALPVDPGNQHRKLEKSPVLPLPIGARAGFAPFVNGVVPFQGGFYPSIDPRALIQDQVHEAFPAEPTHASLSAARDPVFRERAALVFQTQPLARNAPDTHFLLSLSQVFEIMDPLPIQSFRDTKAPFLGFIGWRQQPVPLIDLDRQVGLDSAPEPSSGRILLTRLPQKNQYLGLPTVQNSKILRPPFPTATAKLPKGLKEKYFSGCFRSDGQRFAVLDLQQTIG